MCILRTGGGLFKDDLDLMTVGFEEMGGINGGAGDGKKRLTTWQELEVMRCSILSGT